MNVLSVLILAALTLVDPTGDAFGDGGLVAPSSPHYANPALYDLHELNIERLGDGDSPSFEVRLTVGAIELDAAMPNGWSGAVFDVYVDTGEGGIATTLVGPDMLMPPNSGWEYALRLGPDAAFAVRHDDVFEEGEAEAGSAAPLAQTVRLANGTSLRRQPLNVVIDGNSLRVALPWELPQQYFAYAVSGVHDSFSGSGWRQLAETASPWAFSGGEQLAPVIDLLADSQPEQARALRDGVLPRVGGGPARGWPWLVMMGTGVALAFVGLWFRRSAHAVKDPDAPEEPLRTGLPPLPATNDEPLGERPAEEPVAAEELVPSEEPVAAEDSEEAAQLDSEVVLEETDSALEVAVVPEADATADAAANTTVDAMADTTARLSLPLPDPFDKLAAESDLEGAGGAHAAAGDDAEHARLWGRREPPASLRVDSHDLAADEQAAAKEEASEPE